MRVTWRSVTDLLLVGCAVVVTTITAATFLRGRAAGEQVFAHILPTAWPA